MNAGTIQTKDIPETNRSPLRVLHTTITTFIITRQQFDHGLISRRHLHHGEEAPRMGPFHKTIGLSVNLYRLPRENDVSICRRTLIHNYLSQDSKRADSVVFHSRELRDGRKREKSFHGLLHVGPSSSRMRNE
jgi:hypothetical protein